METDDNIQELEPAQEIEEEYSFETAPDTDDKGDLIDWKKEALKEKAIRKRLSEKLNKPPKEVAKPPVKQEEKKETPSHFNDITRVALITRNLSEDEIGELKLQATNLGVDPVMFAESAVWKTHLSTLRETNKALETTPSPSSRSAVYKGKTYNEVVTSDASPTEKQAAFEAMMKAKKNK